MVVKLSFCSAVCSVLLQLTFCDVDVDFVLVSSPLNPAFLQLDTVDDLPFHGLGYLKQFTLCLRVFLQYEHNKNTVTLVTYQSDQWKRDANIALELDYKQHVTGLYVNGIYVGINFVPSPNQWSHICVTWNSAGKVNFYLEGENVGSYVGIGTGESIGGIGTLALGPQLIKDGRYPMNFKRREGINGRTTHFQFWNKVLSNDGVRKANKCQLLGNVVRWETSGWIFYGDVRSVKSTAPCIIPQNANLRRRRFGGACTYNRGLSDIDRSISPHKAYRAYLSNAFSKVSDMMTYCFWIYYTSKAPEMYIVKYEDISGLTGFAYSLDPSSGSSSIQINVNHFQLPFISHRNGWTHVCIRWAGKQNARSGNDGGVDIFQDGLHMWKGALNTDTNILGNGNLTLIQVKDKPHVILLSTDPTEGFSLKINQFHLWSRLLTDAEIGALATCDTSLVGDLVNWYKVSKKWMFADI